MKDIYTITINNREYVHIDTLKYKNESIYHFGTDDDEIFCVKYNENYEPINDSLKISIIKNIMGLTNTHFVYRIKDIIKRRYYKT